MTNPAPKPLFTVGSILMTSGFQDALQAEPFPLMFFLLRHICGDWGDVCTHDAKANDDAVIDQLRIVSSYTHLTSAKNLEFFVITEADRSATTFLLKHEY